MTGRKQEPAVEPECEEGLAGRSLPRGAGKKSTRRRIRLVKVRDGSGVPA